MKNVNKLGLLALVLVLAGAGCRWDIFDKNNDNWQEEEVIVDEDAAMEEDEQAENVHVFAPRNNAEVGSPITVVGEARVFENVVNWEVRSLDEEVLATGYFMANAPDIGQFGRFEERIFLPILDEKEFYLDVFNFSARDGERENIVRRKLNVKDTKRTSVNVYFADKDQVEGGDCAAVDFEKRTVAHTVNTAELAMRELLKGSNAAWAVQMVPEGSSFESVSIQNGVATVNFSIYDENLWNGGSCKVSAIRAQIEQTLKQFPSVNEVVIRVNGEEESILQP